MSRGASPSEGGGRRREKRRRGGKTMSLTCEHFIWFLFVFGGLNFTELTLTLVSGVPSIKVTDREFVTVVQKCLDCRVREPGFV